MYAVILCGGKGTRLKGLTKETQKCMLPLKDERPVLAHQVEYLKEQGIQEIILAVGFGSGDIVDYFGDGKDFGVKIRYSVDENDNVGTAGALRRIKGRNDTGEPILVMNGDTLLRVNVAEMRLQHSNPVTIAVSKMEKPNRYGVITDSGFKEKAKVDKGFVSVGMYLINYDVIMQIPDGDESCSLEKDIFPSTEFGLYIYEGEWIDMGTPKSYQSVR